VEARNSLILVTTLRTTGSIEPYADLKVRSRIEAGLMPGPNIDVTVPYLDGDKTPRARAARQVR
jgi:hypothetical protein